MDCADLSDEYMCNLIDLDARRYRQADAPSNLAGSGGPLVIEVKFDVRKIVEVNEPKVNFITEHIF